MFDIWLYSLISVFIVSFISLAGALVLVFSREFLRKILLFLVSFAAGAMLGSAFLHLLPEIIEDFDSDLRIFIFILFGILIFFILEKIIHWRHCHECYPEENPSHIHPQPFAYTSLIGDGLHNLIDGMVIAGSFLISLPLGITTTLAVILHEIPQEIGDFGILIKAGFSRLKALIFNLLSGLVAVIGAILALTISSQVESFSLFIIPLTIGGFIYIACADLIPEIHKEPGLKKSFWQLMFFVLGIGAMALLLLMEQ
ncbi:MAG: ZIP family metal transporter [bacterium]|nr:ZIP family metal transporter [bacterium]